MPRQSQPKEVNKNRPSSAHPPKLPRTNVLYWRNKVERTVSQNGAVNTAYSVRIEWKCRRVRFPLNTANKNQAANEALKIFNHLTENGWQETIRKFKSKADQQKGAITEPETSSATDTVGDLITANQKYSSARPQTLQAYIKAFRRITAGVAERDKDIKLPPQKKSLQAWKEAVDALPLSTLTPTRIQEWKQSYLKKNGKTATAKRKATTTVNSLIRNSKALFARKMLSLLCEDVELPSPLPFEGVTMEKPPSPRYRSKIDAKTIIKAAHDELHEDNPEAYKMFLLALICGLRVSEIDFLLWDAFDFRTGVLTIENTEYTELKSEDSAGEINLSSDLKTIFKNYAKTATGDFVIESGGQVERSATNRSYRCKTHINTLIAWLRDHGVRATKPIHELRKEIGSIIASEEGIFAASRYLRHSDIRITSAIYADQKKTIVPSVGKGLLG